MIHVGTIFDSPTDMVDALARQFYFTSSSENCHSAFLITKEVAKLQPIHFAPGNDLDCNQDVTMDELVRAPEACRGTSPGPSEIRYEMMRHLSHDVMKFEKARLPDSWHFAHIIPALKGEESPRSPTTLLH